jgi:hypothetical protein
LAATQQLNEQLAQMNAQLLDQVATSNQLVTRLLDVVDSRAPASPAPAQPYKDLVPMVKPYSGTGSPEAWLAEFYLYARPVPSGERARQLIAKLADQAKTWYTLTFANADAPATEAQLAVGLRKLFGKEYAGAWALRDLFHVTAQPSQSGAQRLLALDQREALERQHHVPLNAGQNELLFSRLL